MAGTTIFSWRAILVADELCHPGTKRTAEEAGSTERVFKTAKTSGSPKGKGKKGGAKKGGKVCAQSTYNMFHVH